MFNNRSENIDEVIPFTFQFAFTIPLVEILNKNKPRGSGRPPIVSIVHLKLCMYE